MSSKLNQSNRKLKALLSEYNRVMPGIVAHTSKSLDLEADIVYYIQEKCNSAGIGYQPKLDEIIRDIAIYRSRMRYLTETLSAISLRFKIAEMATALNDANAESHMDLVCERLSKLSRHRREFSSSMVKAERRWLRIQESILSRFED